MAEYVVTEDEYRAAAWTAYEAGAAGREVYSGRDCLTRPIVRCRDCKHLDVSRPTVPYCMLIGSCMFGDDDYCSYGEAREELCR